jgi:hypothetical protein
MSNDSANQAATADVADSSPATVVLPTNPSALVAFLVMRFGMGILGFAGMAFLYFDLRALNTLAMDRLVATEQKATAVMTQLMEELKEHRRSSK